MPRKIKHPGALAGATGVKRKEQASKPLTNEYSAPGCRTEDFSVNFVARRFRVTLPMARAIVVLASLGGRLA